MTNKEISKIIFENNSQFYKLYCKINSCNYKKLDFCDSITNTNVGWPNFVFDINPSIDQNDIDILLTGIKNRELSDILLVYNSFTQNEELFIKNGFKKVAIWNAMALDLTKIDIGRSTNNLKIKTIESETEIIDWLNIVKQEHKISFSIEEIDKLSNEETIKIFIGYFHNIPVSTLLTFTNKNTVGGYMLATLKKFTKKGFGKEMMQYSLKIAKKRNAELAILASVPQGFNLYKDIGYKEYDLYNLYWKLPL